jgi:hypothetical protein
MPLHKNIKRTWLEWEVVDGSPACVLVIETDLDLRPHAPKFDSSELDDLVQSAAEDQEVIGSHFSKVRVVPWSGR